MKNCPNPGKFFIFGFDGYTPLRSFIELIEKFPPSGFLISGHNYKNPDQLKLLVSTLKSASGTDIILAVDQEPGRVQRLRNEFPISKTPKEYLKSESRDDYISWCRKTAEILAETGVNMNLAPIVDLCPVDSDFPVLRDRAFGENTGLVEEFSHILIDEHKKKGILTCAKHFPGLGAARNDPHETLSVCDDPYERFDNFHWGPFRAAVAFGVDSIMTTHVLAKSLDDADPATYSARIVQHIRHQIGHSGLIVSDDLCMKGAGNIDRIGQSAYRAIKAGHNLLIISDGIESQQQAIDYLRNYYDKDETFRKVADANDKIIDRIRDRI